MATILVTGAGGFVGRALVSALAAVEATDVRLIARQLPRLPNPRWAWFPIDLRDGDLTPALTGATTLVHLAAATGRGSHYDFHATNVTATRRLLVAARQLKLQRVLFVSSVAATYADRKFYHYAESKRLAETLVRESGLDWMILRPTMVFGSGSPVQRSLVRLASAPVGIVFGRGDVQVQPIHVSDLAAVVVALLARPAFGGSLVEAGGPEVTSLIELLRRMRRKARGTPGPFLQVPLRPVREALGLIDRPLWRFLPFTAGQLAAFANSCVARPLPADLPSPKHRIDHMLAEEWL
jgi:nucleoside-diphosphate-sugar epimerase